MIASTWTGPGEDLREAVFGWLTVEAAAPTDGVHLRAFCRCRCGRIAIRRIAALCSGEARACVFCGPAEREERERRAAEEDRLEKPARRRQSPEEVAHEAERERINAAERALYPARKDARNERRRARYVPHEREPEPCHVPGCAASIGRGRRRYCDEHGVLPEAELDRLTGRRGKRPPRDAGRARERRRERRATDPAFRAMEARLAREYRQRLRAKAQRSEA